MRAEAEMHGEEIVVTKKSVYIVSAIFFGVAIVNFYFAPTPPTLKSVGFLVAAIIGFSIIHELIHAAVFRFSSKTENIVSFGVSWRYLAFYTQLHDSIDSDTYLYGVIAPFLVQTPMMLMAYYLSAWNPLFLTLALFSLFGSYGDIALALKLLKQFGNTKVLVRDHPTKIGCVLEG